MYRFVLFIIVFICDVSIKINLKK